MAQSAQRWPMANNLEIDKCIQDKVSPMSVIFAILPLFFYFRQKNQNSINPKMAEKLANNLEIYQNFAP